MANTVEEFEEHILDVDVTEELETSFLEYAYSVIYARALPDARDGLKPVQRRILFSMDDMGIGPEKAHVKCARVVGQVMGVLHPHGDGAIYDALVRLAQPWAMRLPLVDGHGNFGSLDAGPAAMRYTECRMAHPAVAMTESLDEDVVDFKPNYDGKDTEPEVLPAAIPNLLVNGTSGIAVGMATNLPPHNLREVVSGLKALLRNREVGLEELMRHIPGPDFPGGGRIIGLDGICDAYATGRGSFKVRAKASIERVSAKRRGIVVTELPYLVGPEKIIEQIKKQVEARKLIGIADVKDLTDLTHGTRLVIEVKNGINPEALLEQLYRSTKLEDTFATNAVALVEGQPRTLTLKQLLEVFLDHRLEVITRRTEHRLGKAMDRLHLVRGLLTAIADIDEVITIVRTSDDAAEAKRRLMGAFDLDDTQASYILDMQLRRLTKYSTLELESEAEELASRIAGLRQILDDPEVLHQVVADELDEVADRFGTPRRTVLLASDGVVAATGPLEVPDEPCWVLLSSTGRAARTDSAAALPVVGPRSNHDVISAALTTTSHAEFGVITNRGRLVRARAIELPTVPLTATSPNLQGGSPIAELWPLNDGERVVGLTTLDPEGPGLAVGTRRGVVKRVNPEIIGKDFWDIIRLEDNDEVVAAVELTAPHLAFITTDAQLLHFSADLVRPQGRLGGGVAGIKLAEGAEVLFFGGVNPERDLVVTVAAESASLFGEATGGAKVTPLAEYPTKGRATGGVRCQRFLKGETELIAAAIGGFVTAATRTGEPVELPTTYGRRDGSGSPLRGVVRALGARDLPEVVE